MGASCVLARCDRLLSVIPTSRQSRKDPDTNIIVSFLALRAKLHWWTTRRRHGFFGRFLPAAWRAVRIPLVPIMCGTTLRGPGQPAVESVRDFSRLVVEVLFGYEPFFSNSATQSAVSAT